ncbi:MAG: DNA repair protein RecO [Oscillospiraceae bacterium]|nr:DNA repair protein RecO [Oscillospiraceae bacterium]
MLITIDGLVISRREFGESSCFIDIFTKEYGVIEVMAKGVKKLNHPLAQATGLFAYSSFCLNKKSLKYTINSAKCKHVFHSLSGDLALLSLAAYFAELIKYTQLPEQSSGDVLKAALIAFTELEHGEPQGKIKTAFEVKLIDALGISHPDIDAKQSETYLTEQLGRGFKTLDYYKSIL